MSPVLTGQVTGGAAGSLEPFYKILVSKIMGKLSPPKDTKVLVDSHYRCARCTRKKPTRSRKKRTEI
jgi:hypothetical protein